MVLQSDFLRHFAAIKASDRRENHNTTQQPEQWHHYADDDHQRTGNNETIEHFCASDFDRRASIEC